MDNRIPEQVEGGFSDIVSKNTFATVNEAVFHFKCIKKRFFDINSWELFAGEEQAEFALCDENGDLILSKAEVGNYVRIKIPVLHNLIGGNYDWVKIEVIDTEETDDSEMVFVRVRPSQNPTKKNGVIAHFHKANATSCFIIKRDGKNISCEVHGRNELPNTDHLTLLQKLRNEVVSLGGAVFASKFQWKSFTDGIIEKHNCR